MLFLWVVVAFLIVIFSTSQLISYVICFLRYPELMKGIPNKNKHMIIAGIVLHATINIVWIILICTINSIKQHYIAILISSALALFFSIYSIRKDPNLYNNFKTLTGAEYREKVEKELINKVGSIKSLIDNSKKKDEKLLFDLSKPHQGYDEAFDLSEIDDINEIYKNPTLKQQMEDHIKGNNTLDLSEDKRVKFEKMFKQSFADILISQETVIVNKKTTVYYFSPLSSNFGNIGSFLYLAEVGKRNPRYFAVEASYDMTYLLCEWEFSNGIEKKHVIHDILINGIHEMMGNPSTYDRFVSKIKEIIKSENIVNRDK